MKFAVIGDPIAHSKSPAMHAAAYRALGMPHTYDAIRATAAELPSVVARLRSGELAGVNVTVPHKKSVLALADDIAKAALVCDAANTLVRAEGGRIVAHNTDAPAIAEELRALAPDRASFGDATAIVIGNGGAARAAIAALALNLQAKEIVVRARAFADAARARSFEAWARGALPQARIVAAPLATDASVDARASVVVQATSAGMHGADPGDLVASAVAWDALGKDAIAFDVVYAPPETPFLARARAGGLRAANGLGMLARQGALAFELWLGVRPPLDAMIAALGAR